MRSHSWLITQGIQEHVDKSRLEGWFNPFFILSGTLLQVLRCKMKLASLLSVGAQICWPGSECFRNATTRFVSGWAAPNFDLAVEVVTAEDVQNTVRVTLLVI